MWWTLWLNIKWYILAHMTEFKGLIFASLSLVVYFLYKTVMMGRATAALYGHDVARARVYAQHRWYRQALFCSLLVAVCFIELMVRVQNASLDKGLLRIHFDFVGFFLVFYVLAHICNGKSEWGRIVHGRFAYGVVFFFVPLAVTGGLLFWNR